MKTIAVILSLVLATGSVLFAQTEQTEIETTWNEEQILPATIDLPPAVLASVDKQYPGYEVTFAAKSPSITTNGTLDYLVEITKKDKCYELEFTPEGKIINTTSKEKRSMDENSSANK